MEKTINEFWLRASLECKTTTILEIAEPLEKRSYKIRKTSFWDEICWSNVLIYLKFKLNKLLGCKKAKK